ncbi:MAG: prephenate dehydrogenase/arogenate dehydrogenase family protein [Proteobacteria bacterium]|nr:MAG: prephenate dehydrogenase/arogenate dehydrogenase family protein [Pseudomonadota bacterium]
MTAPFERLAVLGLGLLGGSIAWAARERGVAREVVGCGRRAESLRAAAARGLVDRTSLDPAEAVAGADLVVLATPVGAMAAVLRAAAPALAGGALVTDVGSVKSILAELLPGLLPPGVVYVGSHPMAGSHEKGPEHARPDLVDGATCVVTPAPSDPPAAVARIEAFWAALGARVVRRDAAAHDSEVAWISHVPHALAFAFARALGDAPPEAGEVAGTGFRDFTRIARSDPELWAEILVANRKAIEGPLGRVAERLAQLTRAIGAGDVEEVDRWIAEARASLDAQDERRISPDPGAQTRKSGHA